MADEPMSLPELIHFLGQDHSAEEGLLERIRGGLIAALARVADLEARVKALETAGAEPPIPGAAS